jgi:photosystem II stability/assembly factor-like uncharacterized protein
LVTPKYLGQGVQKRSLQPAAGYSRLKVMMTRSQIVPFAAGAIAVMAAGILAGCGGAPAPSAMADRQTASEARARKPDGRTPADGLPSFRPIGASFISPSTGWALGQSGTAVGAPAELLQTRDGGRRWHRLPAPPVRIGQQDAPADAVSDVVFANARDGFLYGPRLLATFNGGRSWVRPPLPAVDEVVVGDRDAYALSVAPSTLAISLRRAAIGSSRWTRLRLPRGLFHPTADDSYGAPRLYAEGSTLVLLQQGFTGPGLTPSQVGWLWVSATDGTRWQRRPLPCRAPSGGGAAALSIARGHPGAWLVDCFNNEQSSQEQDTQHHLFGTANGGRSWVRLADPTRHNAPDLLADNGSGHAFLATDGVFDTLVGTLDGGLRWQTVIKSGGSFSGWADLDFVSADAGFVVGAVDLGAAVKPHLYGTTDGGRTWRVLL